MIALFGGTFDPVHLGHLASAEELMRRVALDECRLLPCCVPPHRAAPEASAADRLAMVRLAVSGTALRADDAEIRRGGISRTVDSLAALRRRVGPERPLYWVVGADAYAGMSAWSRAERVLELANVLAIARPGAPAPELPDWRQGTCAAARGGAWRVALSAVDVSSSAIRAALASGRRPPAGALPAAVLGYIDAKGLYVR